MPGRLRVISQQLRDTIVHIAKENALWGISRIAGEVRKLGEMISASTVKRILKENGIDPPAGKGKQVTDGSWRKFIDAHMDCTVATDFFTSPLLTLRGIFDAYTMVFIHHGSRRVWISEPTLNPNVAWICNQMKGAHWWFEDCCIKPRYLIRDNDVKFTEKFDSLVKELFGHDKAVVNTSFRAPDMNAFVESQIGHMQRECHDYYWFFRSLEQLARANSEYMRFHNQFRPHQGLGNDVPDPGFKPPTDAISSAGEIKCRKFLGGILKHYYRDAA